MLKSFFNRNILITGLILNAFWVISCNPEKNKIDVSQVNVNLAAEHLENDLAKHSNDIYFLKNKYGKFFELYTSQIIHLGITDTTDTILLQKQLDNFIAD